MELMCGGDLKKIHLFMMLNITFMHIRLIELPFMFRFVSNSICRYILSPFGKSLGIKSTRSKRATPNPILEAAYNSCSRIHHKTVSSGKNEGNNDNQTVHCN